MSYSRVHLVPLAVLITVVFGTVLPRNSLGAATLRVVADASASASDDFTDVQSPPTFDTGAVPIGTLPAIQVGIRGANARARYCQSTASSSGQVLLPASGGFLGCSVRAQVSAWAFAPGGSVNPQVTGASSSTEVTYDDVITATGPPAGTPITLRVRLDLDGTIDHMGSFNPGSAQMLFGDAGITPLVMIEDADQSGPFTASTTADFVVHSGEPQAIELRLVAHAGGSASDPGHPGLSSVGCDFSTNPHQGRLFIDPPAGSSYVLESGGDLRSAPSTSAPPHPVVTVLALGGPSPNPSRGSVWAALQVPQGGASGHWSVIDAAGRVVWRSPALNWTAGSNRLEWSGNDEHGRRVPMGLYFFKVESDLGAQTRRFAAI
jgi:hypothetical protein